MNHSRASGADMVFSKLGSKNIMINQVKGLTEVHKDSSNKFTIIHFFEPFVGDIKKSSFTGVVGSIT